MLKHHWLGLMRSHVSYASNRLLEELNSHPPDRRQARDHRATRDCIAMIYLATGTLHGGPAVRKPPRNVRGLPKPQNESRLESDNGA
jgi:hypothetical protein